MGSAADETGHSDNEEPQRRVRIDTGFALGRSEVSVGDFGEFVRAAKYVTDAERLGSSAIYDEAVKRLATDGSLQATVRVPDGIGPITIRADLRARRTLTSVSIDAPKEGRAKPRINWLLRQLPRRT